MPSFSSSVAGSGRESPTRTAVRRASNGVSSFLEAPTAAFTLGSVQLPSIFSFGSQWLPPALRPAGEALHASWFDSRQPDHQVVTAGGFPHSSSARAFRGFSTRAHSYEGLVIMSRTFVIGDLHGCFDETVELLERAPGHLERSGHLRRRPGRSRPQAPRVRRAGDAARVRAGQPRREAPPAAPQRAGEALALAPLHPRGARAASTTSTSRSCPSSSGCRSSARRWCTRALSPGWPWRRRSPTTCLHMQHIKPPGLKSFWPSKAPADFSFWTNFWRGPGAA